MDISVAQKISTKKDYFQKEIFLSKTSMLFSPSSFPDPFLIFSNSENPVGSTETVLGWTNPSNCQKLSGLETKSPDEETKTSLAELFWFEPLLIVVFLPLAGFSPGAWRLKTLRRGRTWEFFLGKWHLITGSKFAKTWKSWSWKFDLIISNCYSSTVSFSLWWWNGWKLELNKSKNRVHHSNMYICVKTHICKLWHIFIDFLRVIERIWCKRSTKFIHLIWLVSSEIQSIITSLI